MLNGMEGELRPTSAVLLEESTGARVRVWAHGTKWQGRGGQDLEPGSHVAELADPPAFLYLKG